MKKLLIKQCRDPMRWYAGMAGETVDCLGYAGWGEYKSRESSGCVNFVQAGDCEVVEVANTDYDRARKAIIANFNTGMSMSLYSYQLTPDEHEELEGFMRAMGYQRKPWDATRWARESLEDKRAKRDNTKAGLLLWPIALAIGTLFMSVPALMDLLFG